MSKKIYVCFIFSAVLIFFNSSHFTYAQIPQDAEYKEGELIVRFAPKENGVQRTLNEKITILSSFNGGTIKYSFKLVPGLSLVQLPQSIKVKDTINLFTKRPEFLYVEPNYKLYLHFSFLNDTNYEFQWNMN